MPTHAPAEYETPVSKLKRGMLDGLDVPQDVLETVDEIIDRVIKEQLLDGMRPDISEPACSKSCP